MATKQQLQQQFERLQREADELRAKIDKLESSEDGPWEPKNNDTFHYVDCDGVVESRPHVASSKLSTGTVDSGNAFRTREEAERHAKRVRTFNRLHRIAAWLNDGWEPNWDDTNEEKFYLVYHCVLEEFDVFSYGITCGMDVFFQTRELALKALDYLDNQDKAVLRGEV